LQQESKRYWCWCAFR